MEIIVFLFLISPIIICFLTKRESWGLIVFLNILGLFTIFAMIGFLFIFLAFLKCFTKDKNKANRLEEEKKEAIRKKEHEELLRALGERNV